MDKKQLLEFQFFTEKIAREAGNILLDFRGQSAVKKQKSDDLDIATSADLASENYLLQKIKNQFPDHNIISEENGDLQKKSEYTWIIDPLDGTKEYIRGLPLFNVSLTLEYKDEIIIGVVYHPCFNELYSASLENGAYLNGQKLKVSQESQLNKSMVWAHLPNFKNSKNETKFAWKVIEEICQRAYRLRVLQADVTILAWLSRGACEGYVYTTSDEKWWDIAPGILMVSEAGGKVTDLKGKKIVNRDLTHGIVASNGLIHQKLLQLISNI